MKTVELGQLLNSAQIQEVTRIINSAHDPIESVSRLTCYFNTFRDELVKKGGAAGVSGLGGGIPGR